MALDFQTVERFDRALSRHMEVAIGGGPEFWRTMCHQAARISARALHMLFPAEAIDVRRVELIGKMNSAQRFVHIGWSEDREVIDGKHPMHWAVHIGRGLYDPTGMHQLRMAKTPLRLPDVKFLFHPEMFDMARKADPNDAGGFGLAGIRPESEGDDFLWIGYKLVDKPLPPDVEAGQMAEGLVRKHAKKVADLYRKS